MLHEEVGIQSSAQPKLGQPRQALYYSIILNISGDQQNARALINISTIALQKKVALHLSGIDQEGSIFTPPNSRMW